jgi:hypothetical protein
MKKEEERMTSESWKLHGQPFDTLRASVLVKNAEISPFDVMAAIGEFTATVLEAMQNSIKGGPDIYEYYRNRILPAHHEGVKQASKKLDKEKEAS